MNKTITCATWNVHRAQGRDGKIDPERVVSAIETAIAVHAPDILALQEADTDCPPHCGIFDLARIESVTGLRYAHDNDELRWGPESHGFLGTIMFVSPRFSVDHADVIDLPGHCHRGAISLELTDSDVPFRAISTHLSLSQPFRIAQMRILGQYLTRRPKMQTIILGDLNEWRPWGGFALSKQMLGDRFLGPSIRSFPTRSPLLPLDRILTNVEGAITNPRAIDAPATELASDHRPLLADVALSCPESLP